MYNDNTIKLENLPSPTWMKCTVAGVIDVVSVAAIALHIAMIGRRSQVQLLDILQKLLVFVPSFLYLITHLFQMGTQLLVNLMTHLLKNGISHLILYLAKRFLYQVSQFSSRNKVTGGRGR